MRHARGQKHVRLDVSNTSIVDGWSAPCPRGQASMAWWLALKLVTRASVKGKLGGQAWITQIPSLVRLGSEEYDSLDKLGGQAWLTQVPCLVRLGSEEFAMTRSREISLSSPS